MPTAQHHRYHAVASRLPRLPRELVHEVLGDLSIQNILELLCNHNLPYLDECATSHFTIKKFLPPTVLPEVKEYFTLYLKIRQLNRSDPHPHIKEFERDVHQFPPTMAANFIPIIKSAILRELKIYHPFLPVLGHFMDAEDQGELMDVDSGSAPKAKFPDPVFWDTKSAAGLNSIFELIDKAEVKLNTEKKAQLTRMADLLERYPHLLRTCCEKDQQPRNQKHRVDYLRLQASRMPIRQIFENRFVGRVIFAQEQFYLVPYDKVLRVFLKVLERYPPAPFVQSESTTNQGEVQSNPQQKPRPQHRYPEALKVVFAGFAEVYPHPAEKLETPKDKTDSESDAGSDSDSNSKSDRKPRKTPRVVHTRYSLPKHRGRGGSAQPSFYVFPKHPVPRKMFKWDRILPMAEAEFQWLEAFLSICDYMSKMQEEWSQGRSVADYWKTHVGERL